MDIFPSVVVVSRAPAVAAGVLARSGGFGLMAAMRLRVVTMVRLGLRRVRLPGGAARPAAGDYPGGYP